MQIGNTFTCPMDFYNINSLISSQILEEQLNYCIIMYWAQVNILLLKGIPYFNVF